MFVFSNGAGKTTLAMSVLWALTGTMDTRLVNDGKAVDVAHDCMSRHADKFGKAQASKGAVVKLYGNINNKPFEIVRKRSSKKSEVYQYLTAWEFLNDKSFIENICGSSCLSKSTRQT
jgi:DNA repair exonuclease SbcCD ATPase subunit